MMQSSEILENGSATKPSKLSKVLNNCKQFISSSPMTALQFLMIGLMIISFIVYLCGDSTQQHAIVTTLLLVKIFLPVISCIFYFSQSKIMIGIVCVLEFISMSVGNLLAFLIMMPLEGKPVTDTMINASTIAIGFFEVICFVCSLAMIYVIRKRELEETMKKSKQEEEIETVYEHDEV